jgi:hypothetical protein
VIVFLLEIKICIFRGKKKLHGVGGAFVVKLERLRESLFGIAGRTAKKGKG